MTKETSVIKADDFKYPSLDERRKANLNYPNLKNFGFKYTSEIISILDNYPMEEVKRRSHLYYWDICLLNRLGKLRETYIFLFTSFSRGFADGFDKISEKDFINHFLFDYYAEIFYFYFISTVDNIGQILNIYFNLGKDEDKVHFKKLASKIDNIIVKNLIKNFIENTSQTEDYRNAYTHRFPLNHPDYRPELSHVNGHKVFSWGSGRYIKSTEMMKKINESLSFLDSFMSELKKKLIPYEKANAD